MTAPLQDDVSTWVFMPWLQEYVMQNKRLTKEHYGLVFLTNNLQYLLSSDQAATAKQMFLDELAPLARRHLRYEILVMNTIDFKSINTDSYVKHCLAHSKLEEGIEDMCTRISELDLSEVVDFLKDWLDNQIRKEDAAYNAEIMKLGITNG
jgi:hemerythrin-like metal-binding protein